MTQRPDWQVHRFVAFALAALLMGLGLMSAAPARADGVFVDLYDLRIDCYQASFFYVSNTYDSAPVDLRVSNVSSGAVLDEQTGLPVIGTVTVSYPKQNDGDTLRIELTAGTVSASQEHSVSCPERTDTGDEGDDDSANDGDAEAVVSDGRLCFGAGQAPAAIYLHGTNLEVWAIDGSDRGQRAIAYTLDADAPAPAENTLLAENVTTANNVPVSLYQLSSGGYQVNIGPDIEGKVQVCTLTSLSAQTAQRSSFNIYR